MIHLLALLSPLILIGAVITVAQDPRENPTGRVYCTGDHHTAPFRLLGKGCVLRIQDTDGGEKVFSELASTNDNRAVDEVNSGIQLGTKQKSIENIHRRHRLQALRCCI